MHNFDLLKKLLSVDTNKLLLDLPSVVSNFSGKLHSNGNYTYIDNGSNVLAVAHLDTVMDYSGKKYTKEQLPTPIINKCGISDFSIQSIALDDRLGVYYILHVLPKLGINVDVLLTVDEEIGATTATMFDTNKQYNWMFQFDRRMYGTCVMYQYESKKYRAMLENLGYKVETGSFSDIAALDHLGCIGFNFGAGYINEHYEECSTRGSWMSVVMNMFYDFYNTHKDQRMFYSLAQTTPTKKAKKGKIVVNNQHSTRVCYNCKTPLLSGEMTYCDPCLGIKPRTSGRVGTAECLGCGVAFAEEDLTFDGFCYDCM